MKTFYLMCGLPFSGKSTLANRIKEKIGARLVSLDEINSRRGLETNGEAVSDEEWVKTHQIAQAELINNMSNGRDLILDDTNCFRWLRKKYSDLSKAYGYEPIIIYLNVDVSISLKRLELNENEKRRSGLPREYFLNHAKQFEPPEKDEVRIEFQSVDDIEGWLIRNF